MSGSLASSGRIVLAGPGLSDINFAAPVLSREHVGADGIIGLDALQDFRVLIDFRKQTIAVEDAGTKDKRGEFDVPTDVARTMREARQSSRDRPPF